MNTLNYFQPDNQSRTWAPPTSIEVVLAAMSVVAWPFTAVALLNKWADDLFGYLLLFLIVNTFVFLVALAKSPWCCRGLFWITVWLSGGFVLTAATSYVVGVILYGMS